LKTKSPLLGNDVSLESEALEGDLFLGKKSMFLEVNFSPNLNIFEGCPFGEECSFHGDNVSLEIKPPRETSPWG
jgi:hypothetical protein